MPRVLCLDIGTSSVRASIHDASGASVRLIQNQYQWRVRPPAVEQDARRLAHEVARALDRLLQDERRRIDAVAIAAFWHSLLGVDRNGTPLTPVIPWTDMRADRESERLRDRIDERAVHRRTGCRIHPTYWPARLVWFRERERRTFRSVVRWLTFTEWLEAQWLGRNGISVSQASATGLMIQRTCRWDPELLEACGITERHLAPIVDIDAAAAALRPRWAARWPALASAVWLPAVGDGALNNVGAGCVPRDRATVMIGTSAAVRRLWRQDRREAIAVPFGLWRYRLDRARVVAGGALSNGGNVREWILQLAGGSAAIDRLAEALPPDSHGLTVLPFLAGTRSPDYRPRATGAVAGLTIGTKPEHLLRAGMEAVAYSIAAVFADLTRAADARTIVAAGAALERSRAWTAILADVLGRTVLMPRASELTARGAAALALEHLGVRRIDDLRPPPAVPVRPNRANHRIYVAAMRRQSLLNHELHGVHGLGRGTTDYTEYTDRREDHGLHGVHGSEGGPRITRRYDTDRRGDHGLHGVHGSEGGPRITRSTRIGGGTTDYTEYTDRRGDHGLHGVHGSEWGPRITRSARIGVGTTDYTTRGGPLHGLHPLLRAICRYASSTCRDMVMSRHA